jgi:chromate transporter
VVRLAHDAVDMRKTDTVQRPTLMALAWIMARDANWTIGGGTATIEVLRRAFARRGWMTDAEHQQLFAASRVTPGTNLLAYCTALGWHARRWSGAIVTLVAASVPCTVMAAVAMMLYARLEASPAFAIVVTIGMTIALVLLVFGAWQLARPHLTRGNAVRAVAIVALALALAALRTSPIWILLASAALGALWPGQVETPVDQRT